MSSHEHHDAAAASPRMIILALAVFFAMSLVGHIVFVAGAEQEAGPAASHTEKPVEEHH